MHAFMFCDGQYLLYTGFPTRIHVVFQPGRLHVVHQYIQYLPVRKYIYAHLYIYATTTLIFTMHHSVLFSNYKTWKGFEFLIADLFYRALVIRKPLRYTSYIYT